MSDVISQRNFLAVLAISFVPNLIFIINAIYNEDVVNFEEQYGIGLSMVGFIIISLIVTILIALMVSRALARDKQQHVLWALILFVIFYMIFSTALFHSRTANGFALFSAFVMFATFIWLSWCCTHFYLPSGSFFLPLLVWMGYLFSFAVYVNNHPWTIDE